MAVGLGVARGCPHLGVQAAAAQAAPLALEAGFEAAQADAAAAAVLGGQAARAGAAAQALRDGTWDNVA